MSGELLHANRLNPCTDYDELFGIETKTIDVPAAIEEIETVTNIRSYQLVKDLSTKMEGDEEKIVRNLGQLLRNIAHAESGDTKYYDFDGHLEDLVEYSDKYELKEK